MDCKQFCGARPDNYSCTDGKGRDLFDLAYALENAEINTDEVIRCYRRYIGFVAGTPPTYKQFMINMEEKINDPEFLGDTTGLLRPGLSFDPQLAWNKVRDDLVVLLGK